MSQVILHKQAKAYQRSVPELKTGYTVRVHQKVQEGDKERTQIFEGLIISVHKGTSPTDASFTVRRIVAGVGVEKLFALHSPNITKIEVVKVASVRRSKLFFLRGRSGKSARLSERFTTAGEFDVAIADEQKGVIPSEELASDDQAEAEKDAQQEESAEQKKSKDEASVEEIRKEKKNVEKDEEEVSAK